MSTCTFGPSLATAARTTCAVAGSTAPAGVTLSAAMAAKVRPPTHSASNSFFTMECLTRCLPRTGCRRGAGILAQAAERTVRAR